MEQQPAYPGWGQKDCQPADALSQVKQLCERYMNLHVIAKMRDGMQFDGIIDGMDAEGVVLLVPEEVDEYALTGGPAWRQPPYGRPRYRRYRRQRFPFTSFLFPFFVPFPYFYPGYPFPYQYPPVVY